MVAPGGCRSINTIFLVQLFYGSQWKDADHFQKDDDLHNKDDDDGDGGDDDDDDDDPSGVLLVTRRSRQYVNFWAFDISTN